MTAQLIDFATHNWLLVSAFFFVLTLLIINLLQDTRGGLSPQQAVQLFNREDALAVDVRNESEYRNGHILNAVHLPLNEVGKGHAKLGKDLSRPLIVYCETGPRSSIAAKDLKRAGFEKVFRLQGGLAAWRTENLPVQSGK